MRRKRGHMQRLSLRKRCKNYERDHVSLSIAPFLTFGTVRIEISQTDGRCGGRRERERESRGRCGPRYCLVSPLLRWQSTVVMTCCNNTNIRRKEEKDSKALNDAKAYNSKLTSHGMRSSNRQKHPSHGLGSNPATYHMVVWCDSADRRMKTRSKRMG